jgi:CRISPR-associated endonuclease/helicase Cas3
MVLKNNMNYPIKNTSIYNMLDYDESNINGYEDDFPLQFMYKFKTASELFKVIDNDTKTVLVPYKKGKYLISELLSNDAYDKKKMILNEIGQYSVNIYSNKFEALKKEDGVIFSQECGVYILKDFYYDKVKGVSLEKNLEFLNL